jgi:hypothetical protein
MYRLEFLEARRLLTAAQDIVSLTALRADPVFAGIDGSGIGVAVLDSGTWAQHPDLRNNFVAYFDAVRNGSSSAGSTRLTDARDPAGHGTHVAGTAVSSNPDIGVATDADLIAVRTLPADNESQPGFDTVANALRWVLANQAKYNIRVVNLSIGVPTVNDNTGSISDEESGLIRRLERAGVTVVAAAGNNYASFAPTPGANTPGAYSTLVVGNTWADRGRSGTFPIISGSGGPVRFFSQENDAAPDRFAATSQRPTVSFSLAAPGQEILSTWNDPNKLYQFNSGTSMASPMVSGVVALMQEAAFNFGGRYLTPTQVRTILVDTADRIVDTTVTTNSRIPVSFDSFGNPRRAGANQDLPETGRTYPRMNAYAAVRAVRQLMLTGQADPTPEPPPPPAGTDPDATIETATLLEPLDGSVPDVVTGSVGVDGSVTVGGSDVDVYRVQVLSPGVLSAVLAAPTGSTGGFAPAIRLFSAGGQALQLSSGTSGDFPSLQSARLTPGTYFLGVSAVGNAAYTISPRGGAVTTAGTGGYQLTVGLVSPDPNGVLPGAVQADLLLANDFDPDTQARAIRFNGDVGSDPNPVSAEGERIQIGGTDVDVFRIVAPDNGTLTINAKGAGSITGGVPVFTRVFDAGGRELSATVRTTNGFDRFAQVGVVRGSSYFVSVSSTGNARFDPSSAFDRTSSTGTTGTYVVFFSLGNNDINGTAFSAVRGTVGVTVNGVVGTDNGRAVGGGALPTRDVDFVELAVGSGGLLDLQATPTSAGFTPVMSLWRLSADRTEITRDADTGGRAARIIAPVSAGEVVYVSVTGLGNDNFRWFAVASGAGGESGGYALRSALRPMSDLALLTNSTIATATEAFANTPVYANLGTSNGVETGPASLNMYKFVATFTGQAVIRAGVPTDEPTDPFLRVFDATGTQELAFNDDAAANTVDAQVALNVVAGRTYYIGVSPSSPGDGARGYDPRTGQGVVAGNEGDYVLQISTPPRLSISAEAVVQPAGAQGGRAVFRISLAEPAATGVGVNFATFDVGGENGALAGVDYTAVNTTVSIPAGETSAEVHVQFVEDATPGKLRLIGGVLSNLDGARKGEALTAVAAILPVTPAAVSTTGPDLVPVALTLTRPAGVTIPGDRVSAVLTVRNEGAARLSGRFNLRTVISADGYVAPADPRLATDRTVNLTLQPGRSTTIRLTLTIPQALEAGTWIPLAHLTPMLPTTDEQPLNNTVAGAAFEVEWRFGNVGTRRGVKLTVFSGEGVPVTFALTGPGSGQATRDDANLLSATLAGTTTGSALSLSVPRGEIGEILSLSSAGPLRSLLSPGVRVLGDLVLPPPPGVVRVLGR